MKTSMTFKSIALIALLGAAVAAPVLAQGGPGMGGGPCMQNAGTGAGGPGMGNGGRGGRGMMFNQNTTRGWTLMTPEERTAFQMQMRDVKTYDECVAVQTEHRGAMEVRAREQGVTLPTPRQNGCDNLKARGMIK
jgi:hypothetical protein